MGIPTIKAQLLKSVLYNVFTQCTVCTHTHREREREREGERDVYVYMCVFENFLIFLAGVGCSIASERRRHTGIRGPSCMFQMTLQADRCEWLLIRTETEI